jgi:hypothetical protein
MGNRFAFRLLIALVAIATLAAVGFYAYHLGVAHGLAQSGHALTTPGGDRPTPTGHIRGHSASDFSRSFPCCSSCFSCLFCVRNECQKLQLCLPQKELLDGSPPIAMQLFMACSAEGDQVRFGVIAAMAAKFLMVNL